MATLKFNKYEYLRTVAFSHDNEILAITMETNSSHYI